MSWLKAMREKEPPEPVNPIGTVVIGTLKPDIMTTAKDMVRKSKTIRFVLNAHLQIADDNDLIECRYEYNTPTWFTTFLGRAYLMRFQQVEEMLLK